MLNFKRLRSLFSKKDDVQFVGGECDKLIDSQVFDVLLSLFFLSQDSVTVV